MGQVWQPEVLYSSHMYFVYILKCKDGSLYTGITTNVERRFAEHKKGIGRHYTSAKKVVRVVYTEQHPDRSSASKRESEIKGWRREKKLALIKSHGTLGGSRTFAVLGPVLPRSRSVAQATEDSYKPE